MAKRYAIVAAVWTAMLTLSGCIAVGYTSSGGWFIWPGGLALLLVILFVVFLLRRR
jgi:hypothetical protein